MGECKKAGVGLVSDQKPNSKKKDDLEYLRSGLSLSGRMSQRLRTMLATLGFNLNQTKGNMDKNIKARRHEYEFSKEEVPQEDGSESSLYVARAKNMLDIVADRCSILMNAGIWKEIYTGSPISLSECEDDTSATTSTSTNTDMATGGSTSTGTGTGSGTSTDTSTGGSTITETSNGSSTSTDTGTGTDTNTASGSDTGTGTSTSADTAPCGSTSTGTAGISTSTSTDTGTGSNTNTGAKNPDVWKMPVYLSFLVSKLHIYVHG